MRPRPENEPNTTEKSPRNRSDAANRGQQLVQHQHRRFEVESTGLTHRIDTSAEREHRSSNCAEYRKGKDPKYAGAEQVLRRLDIPELFANGFASISLVGAVATARARTQIAPATDPDASEGYR